MAYMGFKAVEASAAASGARNPGAVAAAIGRRKYGAAAFNKAAASGRSMRGMAPARSRALRGRAVHTEAGAPSTRTTHTVAGSAHHLPQVHTIANGRGRSGASSY